MSASPERGGSSALAQRIAAAATAALGAALLVGALDALGSAEGVARQFDAAQQRLWFALLATLTPLPLLTLAGALQGALAHALIALGDRFRGDQPPSAARRRVWLGRGFALLAAPAVVWVCAQVFSGPRAQHIPGRQLLAALLGVLLLCGGNLAIQLGLRLRDWIKDAPAPGLRARRALALLAPATAALLSMSAIDRHVLPRLYPWFHLSLQATLGLFAELLCAWLLAALPHRRAALTWVVLGLGMISGGWAQHRLQRAQTLRGLALEHTSIVAQVLRADSAVRGGSRASTPRKPLPPLGPDSDTITPPPVSGPRLAGRDVFLITVDALRFDRVTAATMPFVASLLPRAVVFTRAYTQVPHTSFAVATLLTGKPVYALQTLGQDAASHETLPLVLRRFRYKTAAFYPPSVFYVEHERLRRLEESAYGFEYVKFEYLDAPARTAQLFRFLEEEKPQQVFAWVHYLEPHEPYDAHPGGPGPQRPDRERYDGEVRFVDDQIRRLYEYLQRNRPGALLLLAADHGEEFAEHGGRYHGTSLYEEQVHVPLLIIDMRAAPAALGADAGTTATPQLLPQRIEQPVGLIDVAPTVLGLLDIEPSVRMRGHDLSPWLLTQAPALPLWPVFSEIGRKKMVVRDHHKLICDFATDSCQAFDLLADPLERRSVLDSAPAMAAALRQSLDRFIAEARRFEEAPAKTADNAPADQVAARAAALSRGRMGDRSALPALVALLGDDHAAAEQRRAALEVVTLLTAAMLPSAAADQSPAPAPPPRDPLLSDPALSDPATRARLRALFAEAEHAVPADANRLRWAALLRMRLSTNSDDPDDAAATAVVASLARDEHADAEPRLAAALVLASSPRCTAAPAAPKPATLDCVPLLLAALPAAMSMDDPDRVRPLLLALGQTRDPRALTALLALLESVRSRPDVVRALGLLADKKAVPPLVDLLASDPYAHVRAAAATALGCLGGPAAITALHRAQAKEQEPLVRSAIAAALARK